ncbi:MAG TPA: GNAT family N-acetyltransferase, partial [Streptosporangiaceae bacterium]
ERPVRIEPMTAEHASQILAIYQTGIDEGNATFETQAPDWAEFSLARLPDHRFVAIGRSAVIGRSALIGRSTVFGRSAVGGDAGEGGDVVLGWVAISATSSRAVYAGVVEHSVYVHSDARGRGVGRLLLAALIDSTEAAGIWTIQSGIFPENTASIALHSAAGFRIVGRRERIGRHHGRWRDILLMERRSPLI